MKYAVVELKYMLKKTFIVPIIYIDDYVSNFTPTKEFYCYISTNLKDEPKFGSKYCTTFNGSPGLFKVFILAVKDSIEDAINFQELNRIKSVSRKFRQSANTDAELKAKDAKRKKKENVVQKAAQKNANVKNSAYLSNLLIVSESELSDSASSAEDNDETNNTSGAMKTIIENAQNSEENQVSKDFTTFVSTDIELEAPPNAKLMKKEIQPKQSAGKKMKENNTVYSVQKLAGTKTWQTPKSLANDSIKYQEQNRKRLVSGKSKKADSKDGDLRIQKAKRKKTEETTQKVVKKNFKGNSKAQKLTFTKISATSELSKSVSTSKNGDIEKGTITETKTVTVKDTTNNQKQGRKTPLPKNGEGKKPNKENKMLEKAVKQNTQAKKFDELTPILADPKTSETSVLSTSSLSNEEKTDLAHENNTEVSEISENFNGNTYSHFCDESNIDYVPFEIFGDLLDTNSDSLSNSMNEETRVGSLEAIINPDIATEHDTIAQSVDASDLLQNCEPGEGLTYNLNENGTLTLISKVKESIENAANNEVKNLPPVAITSTPLISNTLNCIQNHTGNVSSTAENIDSQYKEAYIELQKQHNDLSDRHLGLQYALSLAAKTAQSKPTVQVPFKEKDGGRIYSCGVFLNARQCNFIDKTKDPNKFVNNLTLAVFTRKTLAVSSVTGTICKNYKYATGGEAKTPLDEDKLKLVYDLVAARTNNDKNFNSVGVNKIIGKKIANIVGADKAKALRILAKQNKEQQL